jgi:hypothetical protein
MYNPTIRSIEQFKVLADQMLQAEDLDRLHRIITASCGIGHIAR